MYVTKNGALRFTRQLFFVILFLVESITAFSRSFGPPSRVEQAFKQQYPEINNVKWEKVDKSFIANFKDKNTLVKVFFDSLGNLLESEKEIELEDLPEKVILYIRTQDETAKIIRAYKIDQGNNSHVILYDVVAKVNYKKSRLTISKDGYLTSRR